MPIALARPHPLQSGVVLALHAAGIALLVAATRSVAGSPAGAVFGLGLGVVAYGLGARHAFDADHIAGIDAAIRALAARGRDGSTVGTWFSLGHSSVVAAMAALVAGGVRSARVLVDDGTDVHAALGELGATVSGVFLVFLGVVNLGVLWRSRRGAGAGDAADPDSAGGPHGIVVPVVAPFLRAVSRPWHIFPIGVLMGLGFDTATEVALLVMAGDGSTRGVPWWAVMALPLLFAAGMSLGDSAMGILAARAYRWGGARPGRRFLVTVTALAAASSLVVGCHQLASVWSDRLGVGAGLAALDMQWVGFGLAGALVVLFAVASSLD